MVEFESDFGSCLLGFSDYFQFRNGCAAFKTLMMNLSVAADLDFKPFGERIDAGYTYAVQPAGNFVGIVVELAASM